MIPARRWAPFPTVRSGLAQPPTRRPRPSVPERRGHRLRRPAGSSRHPLECALVEKLGALGAGDLQEAGQRTASPGLAHLPRELEIARDADDRVAERRRLACCDEDAGLAVAHQLAEAADRRRDDRTGTLHRLEGHHAEALAHRGHHNDSRPLDRALDGRDVTEKADRARDAELERKRSQRRLERPSSRYLELEVWQLTLRFGERAKEHDVALDGNQAADAEEPRDTVCIRLRLAVGIDAVVHDLEAVAVESLHIFEVVRKAAGDRDVHVRETRERAIGHAEVRRLAE